jgi:hypothetical protein
MNRTDELAIMIFGLGCGCWLAWMCLMLVEVFSCLN